MVPFYNYISHRTLGVKVRLEASSLCQLNCEACCREDLNTKQAFAETIGFGNLKFSDFKRLVDENPWIKKVELSSWGEIFLNPELIDIIKYGHRKKITLSAANGANLNTVSENMLEALVKYRLSFLSVSIDGASQETYQIYRKGGDLKTVIENVKKINFYKRIYKSDCPQLQWQFIVFGHNEHELPIARNLAKGLNMQFLPKMNADETYSPIRNKEFVLKETGWKYATRKEFEENFKINYSEACSQLWGQPQINWDGKLLGCCRNIFSSFGNVFQTNLSKCLEGEKYKYAKEMLLGKAKIRQDIACTRCKYFSPEIFSNQDKEFIRKAKLLNKFDRLFKGIW